MDHTLAIAEIAGRDSVAAAVAATRERGFTRLLPTIALTGTETGDRDAPQRAVETLARLLEGSCEVLQPVTLTEPDLWAAMNARFAEVLRERFGIYSPCLGCHLYLHLVRVPVSWEHGNAPVIAGERDSHDGRLKLSQLPEGIDASMRVLAHADIELIQPIRHASGSGVSALVGGDWDQEGGQLGCVLSGNYLALDGSVTYDETGHRRYLSDFFEPVGRAVIDAWRAGGIHGSRPDFAAIVESVLKS